MSMEGVTAFTVPSTSLRSIPLLPQQPQAHENVMKVRPNETTSLFSKSRDQHDNGGDNENEDMGSSMIRMDRKKWQRRLCSITLAFVTSSAWSISSHQSNGNTKFTYTPPAANAMGPNLLAPRVPEKEKTGKSLEMEIAQKAVRSQVMAENAAFEAEASKVFRDQGSEAHQKFIKEHQTNVLEKAAQKRKDRKALIEKLLLEDGVDPFTSHRGRAILFQFDYGVDLYLEVGTSQYNFEELKRLNPQKYGKLEAMMIVRTKQDVAELREEGLTDEEIVSKFKVEGTTELTDRQKSLKEFEEMKRRRAAFRAKRAEEKAVKERAKMSPELREQEDRLKEQKHQESLEYQEKVQVEADMDAAQEAQIKAKIVTEKANELTKKAGAEKKALELKLKTKAAAKQAKEEAKAAKLIAKEEVKAAKLKSKEEAKALAAAAAAVAAASAGSAAAAAGTAASSVSSAITSITSTETASMTPSTNKEISTDEEESSITTSTTSHTPVEVTDSKGRSLTAVAATAVTAGGGGAIAFKLWRDKTMSDENERKRQFKLIMGLDEDEFDIGDPNGNSGGVAGGNTFLDLMDDPATTPSETSASSTASTPSTPSQSSSTPPKKIGLGSIFSKKSASSRETHLPKLLSSPDALAPDFALLLSKILTYGAPGRFPSVTSLAAPPNIDYDFSSKDFDLEMAKAAIIAARENAGLTDVLSAELFATVVNCMIIDIIDLASSSLSLKSKDKKKDSNDTVIVNALNIVLDFMDHAASLFDAVASGVTITPVTYGGKLSKSKLEKMFGIYSGSLMSSFMSDDVDTTQDRVDTLQQVFDISDKKAEGIAQKVMMKSLMGAMKDGGSGEGGGMEGLADMMKAMGGEEGVDGAGMPGFGDPNAELSPEDIKQSVTMMKELVESGSITKEEVELVKQQFQEAYGADITDLIAAADSGDMDNDLGDDGKELLDLFKTVLKEDE